MASKKELLKQFVENLFPSVDFATICATGRVKFRTAIPINLEKFKYKQLDEARQTKGIARIYIRRRKNETVIIFIYSKSFFNCP